MQNAIIKPITILFILFSVFIISVKCEKEPKKIIRSAKFIELDWFKKKASYDSKVKYYESFNKEYNFLIESKKFEDAKQLLFNTNVLVYSLNIVDTLVLYDYPLLVPLFKNTYL